MFSQEPRSSIEECVVGVYIRDEASAADAKIHYMVVIKHNQFKSTSTWEHSWIDDGSVFVFVDRSHSLGSRWAKKGSQPASLSPVTYIPVRKCLCRQLPVVNCEHCYKL